jgi:O-Antigen ligase
MPDFVVPALVAVATVLLAIPISRLISSVAEWAPAGPIALIAASPVMPHVTVIASLSLDDLLPLVGVALLALQLPVPRMTGSRLLRVILVAVLVATVARIAASFVNAASLEGIVLSLAQAIGRPAVLVAMGAYVAIAGPAERRYRFVALAIALVGTFEALFGLLAFAVPLPGGIGMQAAKPLESVYGVCRGRILGTLGLSPNHIGAVFVLTMPVTLGLAAKSPGWRGWLWVAAGAVQAAAIVLTFTRSSILVAVVACVIFAVYERRLRVGAGVILGGLLLVVLMTGLTCGRGPAGAKQPLAGIAALGTRFEDGNDRFALWYAAAHIMVDNPVAGIGLGKLPEFVAAHPTTYGVTPFGRATNSAHNTILLAGAETGVLGALGTLALNLALAVAAVGLIWQRRARHDVLLSGVGLALGGYLIQGMVNNLFTVPATSVLLALLVGAFVAGREPSPASRDTLPSARPSSGAGS